MIVLGVDTSGKTLSVAVAKDRVILAEYTLAMGYRHSITFQPTVDELLTRCDLTLKDVDLFAVAAGPGSFTGIRIGLSSVKAMAYAVGAKAVAVSSLEALASSAGEGHSLIAPMLDARGGRVFSTLLREGSPLMEEKPRPADAWIEEISKWVAPGERMLLLGDGVSVIETALHDKGKCLEDLPFIAHVAPPHNSFIRASAVIFRALQMLDEKDVETDPFKLEARYTLSSSAERMKPGGHGPK